MLDKYKLHVILRRQCEGVTFCGLRAVRPDLSGHGIMPTCRDIAAESDRRYLSDKISNDHVNISSLYCNEHRGQAKQDINQSAQWAQRNVNTRDVADFTVKLLMIRRKQD